MVGAGRTKDSLKADPGGASASAAPFSELASKPEAMSWADCYWYTVGTYPFSSSRGCELHHRVVYLRTAVYRCICPLQDHPVTSQFRSSHLKLFLTINRRVSSSTRYMVYKYQDCKNYPILNSKSNFLFLFRNRAICLWTYLPKSLPFTLCKATLYSNYDLFGSKTWVQFYRVALK